MATRKSGIKRIDDLLFDGTGGPIDAQTSDVDAVGAVQDLLTGHGYRTTGLRAAVYGKFGKATRRAVAAFRKAAGLPAGEFVDQAMLRTLVDAPATNPIVSHAYLTLVLDRPYEKIGKLVSLVAIVEGAGRFSAMCPNTDKAGLSVGIIQWAQKPKRLGELVARWARDAADRDVALPLLGFKPGDGPDPEFQKLVAHLNAKRGGTTESGATTDAKYDLIREPWKTRFRGALVNGRLQRVQVDAAADAFKASWAALAPKMPKLKSERAVGFVLDLANQFGDGGAAGIYNAVDTTTETEREVMERMRGEAKARLEKQFPKLPAVPVAGEDRRRFFLDTPRLADTEFVP
ncbi:MAG TPA: peptidoglycan-binding domain-containing protein [Tepidisphaeraceae bacterium]|nr:peptidoglycan-binding domain-containing protein [Tepidisphaeraceae bacterium]